MGAFPGTGTRGALGGWPPVNTCKFYGKANFSFGCLVCRTEQRRSVFFSEGAKVYKRFDGK